MIFASTNMTVLGLGSVVKNVLTGLSALSYTETMGDLKRLRKTKLKTKFVKSLLFELQLCANRFLRAIIGGQNGSGISSCSTTESQQGFWTGLKVPSLPYFLPSGITPDTMMRLCGY